MCLYVTLKVKQASLCKPFMCNKEIELVLTNTRFSLDLHSRGFRLFNYRYGKTLSCWKFGTVVNLWLKCNMAWKLQKCCALISLIYEIPQEKVNCCFQLLFSSFLPVFKKNSCYVPVLSSCNNCFQNSYLSCYFKYILAILSSPVLNTCTLF